jgi:hypothetical protein
MNPTTRQSLIKALDTLKAQYDASKFKLYQGAPPNPQYHALRLFLQDGGNDGELRKIASGTINTDTPKILTDFYGHLECLQKSINALPPRSQVALSALTDAIKAALQSRPAAIAAPSSSSAAAVPPPSVLISAQELAKRQADLANRYQLFLKTAVFIQMQPMQKQPIEATLKSLQPGNPLPVGELNRIEASIAVYETVVQLLATRQKRLMAEYEAITSIKNYGILKEADRQTVQNTLTQLMIDKLLKLC